jgi:exodeoxyribonuclease III
VRLVTWNVNSLQARLPRVLELLEEHQPDVLCLQETKVAAEEFPLEELREAGYAAAQHSGGRWAGVAILTPVASPPQEVARGLPGEGEARWIEAGGGGLRVVSVYVPNGRAVGSQAFRQKLRFLEAMAERAEALRDWPLVVAGDLNVCPTDLDVYDPAAFAGSTHVTEDERRRLRDVLLRGRLVDVYRRLHREEPGFTWWDYRAGHFGRRMGLRIDQFLVSEELAGRVRTSDVDRSYRKGSRPSDHAPVVLDVD